MSFGVSGRARPISSRDIFGWPLDEKGCGVDLNSEVVTAGVDFSFEIIVPDLLLFDLLLNFSPFPAITNSVFFNSFRCLLLM